MGRERRRIRRTAEGRAGAGSPPPATVQVRSDRVIARESSNMLAELKRVVLVSAVCFGMLGVLVVVDRLT